MTLSSMSVVQSRWLGLDSIYVSVLLDLTWAENNLGIIWDEFVRAQDQLNCSADLDLYSVY